MSLRHQDNQERSEILSRSVRPSSFKLFEKKQMQMSPQMSENEHGQTVMGRRSRKQSMRGEISSDKKVVKLGNNVCIGCEGRLKATMDRIANIQGKLQMLALKVEETTTQYSLESTKQMETFTRIINIEKKCEKIEYSVWELKQLNKTEKIQTQTMRQQVNSLNFQLSSELRVIGQRVDCISGEFSKEDIMQKIELIKSDQNKKLKNMYEALEDMGNLQASLVETVNSLKMQATREARESRQPQGKQNIPKYNTMKIDNFSTNRMDSTSQNVWKMNYQNEQPRKNSYY